MDRYMAIAVSPTEAVVRAAGRLLRAWRRGWRARPAGGSLHRLSDHQLKDVGLHRSQVGGPFGR